MTFLPVGPRTSHVPQECLWVLMSHNNVYEDVWCVYSDKKWKIYNIYVKHSLKRSVCVPGNKFDNHLITKQSSKLYNKYIKLSWMWFDFTVKIVSSLAMPFPERRASRVNNNKKAKSHWRLNELDVFFIDGVYNFCKKLYLYLNLYLYEERRMMSKEERDCRIVGLDQVYFSCRRPMRRPTRRSTVGRRIGRQSTDGRPTQSTNCRPTVDRMSADVSTDMSADTVSADGRQRRFCISAPINTFENVLN